MTTADKDPDKTEVQVHFRDVSTRVASASLFPCWWSMNLSHYELAGRPLHPDDLVLHFSGSGASCMVFVKDIDAYVLHSEAAVRVVEHLLKVHEARDVETAHKIAGQMIDAAGQDIQRERAERLRQFEDGNYL